MRFSSLPWQPPLISKVCVTSVRYDDGSESSTGIPFRIETCQQFTRFEGIQQVHLRAGRAAAGGGRNRLKKTDSTLPPGIMYRRVYG
jgi:hypothetical protein